ncbi:MAG: LruC domain-containing protein [Bacteroidaceae bacterium]
MKRILVKVVLLTTVSFSLFACAEADLGDGTSNKNVPLDPVTVNTFTTQQKLKVNVKYEAKASFEIYGENPLLYADGQVCFNPEAANKSLYSRTTNADGSFSGEATLPASVKEVYIYSPSFNTPTLYKATVEGGAIQATITYASADASMSPLLNEKSMRTIIADGFVNENLFPSQLGKVNKHGVPLGYTDPKKKINVDKTMKSYLDYNLEEGGKSKRYEKYVKDEDNDIHVYEDANISFNFVGGTTTAQSAIGYYCYQEGATETEIKAAKDHACLIFANANARYLTPGVAVNLKYINEKGELKNTVFPEGTIIGFVLQNNGWIGGNGNKKDGENYNPSDLFYSTKCLNSDGRAHTAAIRIKDDKGTDHNIISFEDWGDVSSIDYNDIAFSITSNPIEAIQIPEGEKPKPNTTQTSLGVLSFEDNWPRTVDFDLNDVVVTYKSVQTITPENKVIKSEDTFTLTWSGANESNGFAYQLNTPTSNVKSVTCDQKKFFVGLDNSLEQATITLFADAKAVLNQSGLKVYDLPMNTKTVTFVVTTEFNEPIAADLLVPPYNPFINNFSGYEVHLTGYAPAGKKVMPFGTADDVSDGVKTFYVYKENNYPYALHMDARASLDILTLAESLKGEKRITDKFPGFKNWAADRNPSIIWWK